MSFPIPKFLVLLRIKGFAAVLVDAFEDLAAAGGGATFFPFGYINRNEKTKISLI